MEKTILLTEVKDGRGSGKDAGSSVLDQELMERSVGEAKKEGVSQGRR